MFPDGDLERNLLDAVGETLVELAESHLDWPMPGYTHLQRAQPVYLSHHLLAYVWMLLRDRDRFTAAAEAAGVLPLGSGALAGVNFDTDRQLLARELGFSRLAENSIDYSLQNTARNALYLPTSREAKYKAKQANDTFFVRFGDVLSAGLVFAGTTWLGFAPRQFAMVNVALIMVWLVIAVAIGRRFRRMAKTA